MELLATEEVNGVCIPAEYFAFNLPKLMPVLSNLMILERVST